MKISLLAAALAIGLGAVAPASQLATVTASVTGNPPCTSTYAGQADGSVSAAVTCQAIPVSTPSAAAAPAPGPCPYAATSPVDDGCATAPKTGAFYQPSFAAYGVRSGQPSILGKHPQTYDVPGWDYPEGQAPGDPALQDPATATLPAGCSYGASGAPTSSGYTGGAWIACLGAASPTFSNLDLSLHGCVPIYIYPNVTGVVTLSHVYSKNGANKGCSDSNAAQITFATGSVASLDLETVTLDGAFAPGQPQQNALITFDSTGQIGGHHVAFLDAGSRPISGACPSGESFNGLVVVGMALVGPTGAHGELSEYVCQSPGRHLSIDDENVTFVIPAATPAGSITAPFYFSSGLENDGLVCDLCKIVNVTVVGNLAGGASGQPGVMGEALINLGFQTITQLVIQNVYVDPTGSPYCALVQATKTLGTVTVTGATNLRDGSKITFPKPDLNGDCNGHS